MTGTQPFSPSPDHLPDVSVEQAARLAELSQAASNELMRTRRLALFFVGSDDPLVFEGPSPFALFTASMPEVEGFPSMEGFFATPVGIFQRKQVAGLVNLDDLVHEEEITEEEVEGESWKQGSTNPFTS